MRKIWCAVVSLIMAISVTACGGGSGVSGSGSAGTSGGKDAETGAGIQRESTITMGVSGTPELDPAISTTGSSTIAMVNLYDSLVYPDGDDIVPRAAESWEISDDGLTYTFKLREGIKFHDGSDMTAEDVKFSMDRLLAIGEGYAYIFEDVIESTEAPDDATVVFHLKKTFGPFLSTMIRLAIVNKDLVMANLQDGPYGELGDYGKAFLVTNDAGSGAYRAVELVQQDYFYAEKFDDWFVGWESELAPEAFKMSAITEASTVRTMVNNKELDITDQWQSSENLQAMEKIDGVKVGKFSTYLLYNMYFNTKRPPMDDVNFRRAMSCLIDYDTICSTILPDSRKAVGPVSSGVAGAAATNVLTYDLEKAKEYLAKSKYADTYQEYPIEILCNSDVADLEKIALMIQSAASQVGISIEISKAPWVSIIDKVGAVDTTPHMLPINSAPAYNEAGSYLEARYTSKTAGTWEQGEWLENGELDSMIEDALATVDKDERFKKYEEIQNYIVDELCPTAWLCDFTERIAYHADYISWPALENAGEDGIADSLHGYLHAFANMELHLDKKNGLR